MKFKSGQPRPAKAGRKKGSANKVTVEIRDMIRGALDDAGGRKYLKAQSKANPVAFMGLIGKIIPADVNAKLTGSITVTWEK